MLFLAPEPETLGNPQILENSMENNPKTLPESLPFLPSLPPLPRLSETLFIDSLDFPAFQRLLTYRL